MKAIAQQLRYYLPAATLLMSLMCDGGGGVSDGGSILVVDSRVSGTFYEQDGTPAGGATVIMRPMDYLPPIHILAKRVTESAVFICSTITSGKGEFFFDSVAAGTFLIEGISSDGRNRGFIDSIVLDTRILQGDSSVRLDSVLLKPPASIWGTVRITDDSATGLVFVYGFDTYTTIEADGNFLLENLPEGEHRLEIVVSIDGQQSVSHISTPVKASETTVLDTIEQPLNLLRYDGNGSDDGTVPVDGVHYAAGDTVKVSLNTLNLSKNRFSFIGWNNRSDGSGIAFALGESFVKGATEEVLYAQWTPRRYSLTVAASGNGTAGGTDSVACGVAKLITAVPGAGSRFLGWHVQDGTATFADTSSASTSVILTGGNAVVVAGFGTVSRTVFKRTYGGTDSDDGGYIIAGSTEVGIEEDNRIYLLRTDDKGDSLWSRTFEELQYSFANEVQQTDDGGFVIIGCMLGEYDNATETSNDEVYLIKTDANGEVK